MNMRQTIGGLVLLFIFMLVSSVALANGLFDGMILVTPTPVATPTSQPTNTPKPTVDQSSSGNGELNEQSLSYILQKLNTLYGTPSQQQTDQALILCYENVEFGMAGSVFSILGDAGIVQVVYSYTEKQLEITFRNVAPLSADTTAKPSANDIGNSHYESCPYCGGYGYESCAFCSNGREECFACMGEGTEHCYACGGTGEVYAMVGLDGKNVRCSYCGGRREINCTLCDGHGYESCSFCGGTGRDDCVYCENGKVLVFD